MADRIHIPQGKEIEPGTWCVFNGGELLYRCPQCKRSSEMLNHSVTQSGEVNASIACFPPCSYHVWGILDGWIYGEKHAGDRVNFDEQTCPGHIASNLDPKTCARCGVHINSLHPDREG
jgi:DNA-directed RNA polymerase subunit RPC12/RpoP